MLHRLSTILGRGIIVGDRDAPRALAYDALGNGSAAIPSMASRHASDLQRRGLSVYYVTLGWGLAGRVVFALTAALGRRRIDLVDRLILACYAARDCVLISRLEMAT